jgi:hypothetical protein
MVPLLSLLQLLYSGMELNSIQSCMHLFLLRHLLSLFRSIVRNKVRSLHLLQVSLLLPLQVL